MAEIVATVQSIIYAGKKAKRVRWIWVCYRVLLETVFLMRSLAIAGTRIPIVHSQTEHTWIPLGSLHDAAAQRAIKAFWREVGEEARVSMQAIPASIDFESDPRILRGAAHARVIVH